MKIASSFWVSIALFGSRALAVATDSVVISATATSTTTAPSCTASLITSLCTYPDPGPEFAVASSGRAFCWEYCNANPPCSFVIFNAGNPTTGTGTCWLYPGESFNASEGSTNCGNPNLSVYNQPVCSGGSATTTATGAGACAATATPSAIASVCGYPPPVDCFDDCVASSGASNCLSLCAKADACSYAVFNPESGSTSPYGPGNCWIYPNGTYDAGSTTTCSGSPEQFVYNNACPKPSPKPSPSPSSSSSSSSSAVSSSVTGQPSDGTQAADNASVSTSTSKGSAPTGGLSLNSPMALGAAILVWQAL